jgi:hypothetical protein
LKLGGKMKKCPYCAEIIQNEAIVCRYCGRDINPISNSRISVNHPVKTPNYMISFEDMEVISSKLLENPFIISRNTNDEIFKYIYRISEARVGPVLTMIIKTGDYDLLELKKMTEFVTSEAIKLGRLCFSAGVVVEKKIINEDSLKFFLINFAFFYTQIYRRIMISLLYRIPQSDTDADKLQKLLLEDENLIFMASVNIAMMGRRDFYTGVPNKYDILGKTPFEIKLEEICLLIN